jgi:hypothetical protein
LISERQEELLLDLSSSGSSSASLSVSVGLPLGLLSFNGFVMVVFNKLVSDRQVKLLRGSAESLEREGGKFAPNLKKDPKNSLTHSVILVVSFRTEKKREAPLANAR